MQTEIFSKEVPEIGNLSLRPLRIGEDIPRVHDWVNRRYAQYWGMQDNSPEEVAAFYRDMAESDHANAFLGLHRGTPAFLLECYQPAHDPIGEHYPVQPGDHGMHILVGPPERPIPGFTWSVFTLVMDFMFSDPAVRRVVVEPDVRNTKIHVLNRRAGFEYQQKIDLPEKTAHLAFCTRDQYKAALGGQVMA